MKELKHKTYTVKVSENTMKKMEEYFKDKKRIKTPPYAVFQADEADTVVTLYNSGKAVFQGISADIDANIWIQFEKNLNPDKKIDYTLSDNKNKEKKQIKTNKYYNTTTIGSDEVGTGDFFGPIVVCATYVTKDNIPFLEELGVKDSKKMTDETIIKIVPKIIKKIPYECVTLSNKEYNEKNESMNMNSLKAHLHNKVLFNLNKKYQNHDFIIVDQFTTPRSYYNYLKEISFVQKGITFVTKAEDQCLSVACASLISRFVFLKEMEKIEDKLGIKLPKGAGEKVDEIGAELVKKYGENILKEIAKCNFKNIDKIKELVKNN